jgi:hypothetical protein
VAVALKATLARAISLGRGRITSWPATRGQTAAPIIQIWSAFRGSPLNSTHTQIGRECARPSSVFGSLGVTMRSEITTRGSAAAGGSAGTGSPLYITLPRGWFAAEQARKTRCWPT